MVAFKTEWDLEKYYYSWIDDPKFNADFEAILPAIREFRARFEPKLKDFTSPEEMLEFYEADEAISKKMNSISLYLFYRESLDTQDSVIKKKQGELESLGIQLANELLFVNQAWKSIGYDRLIEWSNSPLLQAYKNDLVSTAESVKRILSEKEEYVLNIKSRPLSVPVALYEELTNSFEFEIELDGVIQKKTDAEIRALRESSDREIRKKAVESLRKVYLDPKVQITIGNTYASVIKEWSTWLTLRGYSTVMEPRNISEEMENETIDMLMQEVQNAYPLYARYIKAKWRLLGVETMYNYDLFAPVTAIETPCSIEEGITMHLDTMKEFDQEFYEYSKDMLESWRVDVFPKKWKRGGAFASYTKWEPSFVLLNYTGKLLDVPVVSHELGHAIHGHLSQAQKDAVYGSPLCLAETASIFSEMLLSEKIRSKLSEEEYVNFLSWDLSDAFGSIFRQVQYVAFERRAHEIIHTGGELTYHDFNLLWREEQKKLSLDAMVFDSKDEEEVGWSTIPHIFHTPFYCYAYAFGQLLTYALYAKYQEEGAAFIPKYKEILRAGGSVRPKDLLAKYGLDITKKEFYRLGLGIIEKKVEEFERLAAWVSGK